MNRLRVLKLGWEFPPLINGGLGIACLGLSQALARHVDLRVVVPRAAPDSGFEGFELLGLNHLRIEDVEAAESVYRYESFAQIDRVPIHLDPYDSDETTVEKIRMEPGGEVRFSQTTRNQLEQFKMGDLYGSDLGSKVIEFSKIAAKLALQSEFDIVHAHDWMTFLAGVEVKKATGKPLVLHVHASQYDRAGADARGWIFEIEKYGMEQADAVIPVSRYTGQICASHYGIKSSKIHPVHNGAEPVKVFSTKKKFPEKLVLFLGRLTAQKGPEFFLEIAAKVLERNRNVRFVMAGTGERLKPLIESGAFRGLGGYFHFTGFLNKEKVNELLSMTDIYCMPSVSEPFGLSALEAAQFGIPAVISKQSGVAEVLKGALKADFWDVELMARHITDLLNDDELRERVVQQAAKDMAASTWDAAAAKVLDVYRSLMP
ncbi:MAG: glycosyltransferase family 1 protein [Verrucomicrobia bacterium]|nr:MAG: glycosyltransferase family 1 protein [Verrucomicrobiota bacterium]TAE89215.1 MAG: glycosyltransferase family 1 protein [Verrucomicrobiota bacterium]TAF27909.1 MAG: glycosyltransferase family 1 protein [Verrucomicrobiota bacterium]TAF42758.1 MAG: glycosyltransferase family 1 protein [Verrucomicrobiota bacterium]